MPTGDFTPQADAYARARPGYPPELVDRLLARAAVSAGDAVADLGAGTGLFTASLVGRGLRVTAVEPGEAMRSRAPRLPGVTWVDGTFEATGLPSASQRWAVAAQAFHWAEPARALPEVRRVLVPGGRFTVLWNDRDPSRSAVLAWTRDAILRHAPAFEELYRALDWSAVLTATGDFTGVIADQHPHVVPMSRARYLDLWRSHHRLTAAAGAEGMASLLSEIDRYLSRERIERVEVPYTCRAWTARAIVG